MIDAPTYRATLAAELVRALYADGYKFEDIQAERVPAEHMADAAARAKAIVGPKYD